MWRGYGAAGNGVAVIFDTSKLQSIEHYPLVVGRVHYASQQDRIDWIVVTLDALAAVITAFEKTRENFSLIAALWFERLKLFSLFTKHEGFREEREWRVVYLAERDPNRKLEPMFGYAITSKGAEPKMKLRMDDIPETVGDGRAIERITDRIILGPSLSSDLSLVSLQRMLQLSDRGVLAEKLVASSIPFRP